MAARLIFAAILIACAAGAHAADKVALLIGNAAYTSVSALSNPVNDVRLIEMSLAAHGFDVTRIEDQTLTQMNRALRDFRDKADSAEVAMVYYAGHGIEVGGVNYLIPTDAELTDERDAPVEALSAGVILRQISGAKKLKLMVLDACRDNPFAARMIRAQRGRSVGRGLARTTVATPDTLIAYAAAAGEITPDGPPGGNSPFSAAFARAMEGPQRDVRQLFGAVRDIMRSEVAGAEPFVYTSLGGADHYIQNASAPAPSRPAPAQPAPTNSAAKDYELAERIGSAAAWRAFLARHGEKEGFYVALARAALAKLENAPAPATQAIASSRAATAPVTECDRLAANPDDTEAVAIGVAFQDIDTVAATRACRQATADHPGVARIEFQLGRSLARAERYKEALVWYRRAAENGSAAAMHNVGATYRDGEGVTANIDVANDWFRRSAEAGNASGMTSLGWSYEKGRGVGQDYAAAADLYEKAAALGGGQAMNNLAGLYRRGKGVAQSYETALDWYRKSAAAKNPQGTANLGWVHEKGFGVEKDYATAARWYREAIALGNVWALNQLGWYYENGHGVEVDLKKALSLFQQAADRNDARGMTNVGYALQNGRGAPRDYAKAREWYEKAAAKNYARAMNNLGSIYDNGQGVAIDGEIAGKWLTLSVGWGFRFALNRLTEKPSSYEPSTRKAIQRRLRDEGYYKGAIDGAFGPATAKALNDYFGVLKP